MQCSQAQTPLGSNSLNSIFNKTQENLNGTRNPTKQVIETPSHFMDEEIVETRPTTTPQSISPIHPTLTTPKKYNISANNYTIHSKTFYHSKILTNGFSNI